jgi:hypothetical protein
MTISFFLSLFYYLSFFLSSSIDLSDLFWSLVSHLVADDEEEKELLLGQLDGVAAALEEVLKSISNDADLSDVQMSAFEVNSNIDEIRDIMFGSLDIDFGDEEEYDGSAFRCFILFSNLYSFSSLPGSDFQGVY